MSNKAPVCEVAPVLGTTQPDQKIFPLIPIATDLKSALAAINALRLAMLQLTNQAPRSNNIQQGVTQPGGFTVRASPSNQSNQSRYQEVTSKRVTNEITVHSSEDPDTTLTFKRIDQVVAKDTKTGELWTWVRNDDQ